MISCINAGIDNVPTLIQASSIEAPPAQIVEEARNNKPHRYESLHLSMHAELSDSERVFSVLIFIIFISFFNLGISKAKLSTKRFFS